MKKLLLLALVSGLYLNAQIIFTDKGPVTIPESAGQITGAEPRIHTTETAPISAGQTTNARPTIHTTETAPVAAGETTGAKPKIHTMETAQGIPVKLE